MGDSVVKDVTLTSLEKRVAKALLAKKWRNQDIQALINTGRKATVKATVQATPPPGQTLSFRF